MTTGLTKSYHLGGYLTENEDKKGSVLIGKSCLDRSINYNYDVTVIDIIRIDKQHIVNNIRRTILKERYFICKRDFRKFYSNERSGRYNTIDR